MEATEKLAPDIGSAAACRAMGVSRATLYRRRKPLQRNAGVRTNPRQPRSLGADERQIVLDLLHSPRFVDKPPAAVHAALLDEGKYHCSVRTMYRILHDHSEVRERRNQLRHPNYKKPELLATGPNQVWSWDITKLLGPTKWTYYHLYVILDIYSRYTVAQLMATLGVTKSHSRPHVSNDNPFSESQFKTLKYRPGFPDRFGSQQDAQSFCGEFFHWYNDEHYHSGLGMLTPASVHYGHAAEVLARRVETLDAAYAAHPERFVGRRPRPLALPEAVWINPPATSTVDQEKGLPTTIGSQKPDAPSAHPRSGYPSPGCVPAEPGSVSPDPLNLTESVPQQHPPSDTRAMPQKIPGAWGLAPTSKKDCSRSESKTH